MYAMKFAARPALAPGRFSYTPHVSFANGSVRSCRSKGYAIKAKRDGDKSWSDLASEATEVAKSAIDKLKHSIQNAAGALVKKEPEAPSRPARRDTPEDLFGGRPPSLLGGLVGRAVGSVLGSALSSLTKQMEAAAKETNAVYEDAAFRIRNDDKAKEKMGSIQCSQPMSQSVSSSSINGQLTKNTTLLFMVYGSSGLTGQAQVRSSTDSSGRSTSEILVQLQTGEVIKVGGGSGKGGVGPAGDTIDVEYWEVK